MTADSVRSFCLSLPAATEKIQWGSNLLFCVGGKMFAVMNPDAGASVVLSLKCIPETFALLTERDGIIPAPYLARYQWVALTRWSALRDGELKRLIGESYEMIRVGLPKNIARLGR